jgi:hypothetical protein
MLEFAHHGNLLVRRDCPYAIADDLLDLQPQLASRIQWKGVWFISLVADPPKLPHQRDDQTMKGPIDSRRAERGDTGWFDLRIQALVVRAKPFVVAPISRLCLTVDDHDEPGLV